MRESLQQIIERVCADLQTTKWPFTEKSALAFAIAGCSFMLRDHLDLKVKQSMPEFAEGEHLDEWAKRFGLKRKDSSCADGFVEISGEVGALIPKDTLFQVGEQKFITTSAMVIGQDRHVKVPVRSLATGSIVNIQAGSIINLVNSLPGILTSGRGVFLSGGSDIESDASLRSRLLKVMKTRPRCGNKDDYIFWVESVPGVKKAWVCPVHNGPGTVAVTWAEHDGSQSDALEQKITDQLTREAPMTTEVELVRLKKIPVKIPFEVTPNDFQLVKKINEALRVNFPALSEPPGFFSYHERKTLDRIPLSKISEIISRVEGEESHKILLSQDLTCSFGEVLTLEID